MVVTDGGDPVAPMRDGDSLICWNYRSDRMRQIVRALVEPDFDGFDVRRPRGFLREVRGRARWV